MEVQEIFYTVAIVALVLLSIVLIGLGVLIYRIQKFIKSGTNKIDFLSRDLTEKIGSMGKTWGAVSAAGIIIKLLRTFIFRR